MRKRLLILAVGLLILFSACSVNKSFGADGEFQDLRNKLKVQYDCIQIMSLSMNQADKLSLDCKLSGDAKLQEIIEIYAELRAFLADREFLAKYLSSVSHGPGIFLNLSVGAKSYPGVQLMNASGYGAIYDESKRENEELVFHKEMLSQRSEEIPAEFDSMVEKDLDGDGAAERLLFMGNELAVVDSEEENAVCCKLINDKLTSLLSYHSGTFVDGDSGGIWLLENRFYLPDETAATSEIDFRIEEYTADDSGIYASVIVYVDSAQGQTPAELGRVSVPIYYDQVLGFRAGKNLR